MKSLTPSRDDDRNEHTPSSQMKLNQQSGQMIPTLENSKFAAENLNDTQQEHLDSLLQTDRGDLEQIKIVNRN